MKPTKIFLSLFVVCSVQLQGQALLWEISGNGLQEKSYLFGTIRIQDRRVFDLDSVVWRCFNEAPYFASGFDSEKVDQFEWANRMLMEKSYLELLSDEDFQKLGQIFQKHVEQSFLASQRIKPFFVSNLITQSALPKDHKDPLGLFFLKKAQKAKKNILELESFDEQMTAIDQIPLDTQVNALIRLIYEPDLPNRLREEAEVLVTTYLSQDDDQFYRLILESESAETFMKPFVAERNHRMAQKIRSFISDKSVFIVVDAEHLSGDEGIVKLLKNAGYFLTAINY